MTFADASRFAARRDVVLVGYRGIDGSSRLDCPEVGRRASTHAISSASRSYRADAAAFRACANRLQRDGVDLAGYALPERVDDLEAARRALGYAQVDLLSESAGTRTAMIYAWRYPSRVHRSVMIGVNPPGGFLWDAKTIGEQIRKYAALCGGPDVPRTARPTSRPRSTRQSSTCPGTSGSCRSGRATSRQPPSSASSTRLRTAAGRSRRRRRRHAPLGPARRWGRSLVPVADGGAGIPARSGLGRGRRHRQERRRYARRFFARHADRGSIIGSPGTDLIWAGGRLVDAWPASPDENPVHARPGFGCRNAAVGGALRLRDPAAEGHARAPAPPAERPPGRAAGHRSQRRLLGLQPAAGDRLINTFFDTGRVDTSLYKRTSLDFTPTVSHGAIAKIILAVMLTFAALTVLSLLWLALRARRRAASGGRAALRCVRSTSSCSGSAAGSPAR